LTKTGNGEAENGRRTSANNGYKEIKKTGSTRHEKKKKPRPERNSKGGGAVPSR